MVDGNFNFCAYFKYKRILSNTNLSGIQSSFTFMRQTVLQQTITELVKTLQFVIIFSMIFLVVYIYTMLLTRLLITDIASKSKPAVCSVLCYSLVKTQVHCFYYCHEMSYIISILRNNCKALIRTLHINCTLFIILISHLNSKRKYRMVHDKSGVVDRV